MRRGPLKLSKLLPIVAALCVYGCSSPQEDSKSSSPDNRNGNGLPRSENRSNSGTQGQVAQLVYEEELECAAIYSIAAMIAEGVDSDTGSTAKEVAGSAIMRTEQAGRSAGYTPERVEIELKEKVQRRVQHLGKGSAEDSLASLSRSMASCTQKMNH